jgi:hypothetical protein
MLTIFNTQIVPLVCPNPNNIVNGVVDKSKPCIETVIWGIDWSQANTLFPLPIIGGLSILAVIAAGLQLIQSRMLMPPPAESDASSNVQRQTAMIFPLISIAYGGFLPSGLFLYWITTTIYAIVQQYLIVGFGSLFPLFGWTPGFAVNHSPRFPVKFASTAAPPPGGSSGSASPERRNAAPSAPRIVPTDRAASAAATVRPRERGRQGRRGRRR